MDRRKELKDAYKSKKPPMGVLMLRQKEGDALFLSPAKDLSARRNRLLFQLNAGVHPHKTLQALWNQLGASGFDLSVLDVLEYPEEDTGKDFADDLMELCQAHLEHYEKGEILV